MKQKQLEKRKAHLWEFKNEIIVGVVASLRSLMLVAVTTAHWVNCYYCNDACAAVAARACYDYYGVVDCYCCCSNTQK
jgi:hypothetical protein